MKNFEVIHLNPGNLIICDSCNIDYTSSDKIGGVLFNRNAYCPNCYDRIIASAKKYNEEKYLIHSLADETFRDFVYRIRPLMYAI